jgi:pimeloyl-ACP methyl ester carboxylesterase
LKVLVSDLSGRNSPVKVTASEKDIASLERLFIKAPPPLSETISYLRGGDPNGRRIVFIHGTPGNARGWADYLVDMRKNRLHIALDRPGFGRSGPRGAVVSMKRQAAAIKPFLRQAESNKTILVGHSLGASVAVQAALDYAESVGGLLLLAGAFDPDLEEANYIQLLGTFRPLALLLPRGIENSNRELLALKRELVEMAETLHKLSVPIGIVHGARDPLVPYANVAYMQKKLARVPLDVTTLKDADHFIPWHFKPAVEDALQRLIDRVRRTEPNPRGGDGQ